MHIFFILLAFLIALPIFLYIFPSKDFGHNEEIWETASLRAEILGHPRLWNKGIKTEVHGNVVTIIGHLKNENQMSELLDIMAKIPATKTVINHVTVDENELYRNVSKEKEQNINIKSGEMHNEGENQKPEHMRREKTIMEKAKSILHNHPGTTTLPITLKFANGILQVEGELPNELAQIEVEELLSNIKGVSRVEDLTTIERK